MELINTIELDPYGYAVSFYEYPDGSSLELPEEWNKFWLKCISDKGLDSLKAIKKGSYLVDIETIGDQELEIILRKELMEIDLANAEDEVGRLSGGIVVREHEQFLIEPTCCGDLGNLKEWERIFENESTDWTLLWIGHSWIFYKRKNRKIKFSNYTNLNNYDNKLIKEIAEYSEKSLHKELIKIQKQQYKFERRICQTFSNIKISNNELIAKIMTENS